MSNIIDYHLIKLKCWIILREDLSYSYNRILEIGITSIIKPFHKKNIREEWIEQGNKFETIMTFNLHHLERVEKDIIDSGLFFRWIYDGKIPVGILIEPTRHQCKDNILKRKITLIEYSKHRLEQFEQN